MPDTVATAAHSQRVQHSYIIAYPKHDPRDSDPHYVDFQAFRRRTQATAKCTFGERINDFADCGGGLQLHHSHIEFAMQNAVNLKHLEAVYPGISDPNTVGAWVETAANLIWLCEKHHISAPGGIHDLSASDYEGSSFVMAIFTADPKGQNTPVDNADNVAVVESSVVPTFTGEPNG